MMRLKNILVPVDFSDEAELAVEWAVKLAKEEKESTLYLLHVLSPIPILPEAGYDIERVIESEIKDAKRKLEAWQKKVPPPLASVTLCDEGDLSTRIKSVCDKENIDLVVVTTHGRHGLSRIVHPNVTEKIVREVSCPVLVLHLNPKMEEAVK